MLILVSQMKFLRSIYNLFYNERRVIMKEKDFINGIESFKYEKYSIVSSREKLLAFTIQFLVDNGISSTFNNLCIAAFKLFPEKFYFSEDFKEYPHIEMLNRTLLHLRPKERNYAIGNSKIPYTLTDVGREIAYQVKNDMITDKVTNKVKQVMDPHKNESIKLLSKLKNSGILVKYDNGLGISDFDLFDFFKVTPYTQEARIKVKLSKLEQYCSGNKEDKYIKLIEILIKMLD